MRKRISSKDVAKEAGVSQATVSYVLNDTPGVKIKPETRRLVLDAAAKLDYHANFMARNMRLRRASSIGLVTDKDMSSFIFMTAMDGIKNVLLERGFSITMCLAPHEGLQGSEYVSYYHSNLIDGVIFLFTTLTDEEEMYLLRNNIPHVIINAHADTTAHFQVKTNVETAIDAAVARFLERGAREIGFIGNAAGKPGSQRFAGYTWGLEKRGLAVRQELVRQISGNDEEIAAGVAAFFGGLPRPPKAVFCDQVTTGMHTLRYAHKHGIRVPEDLAVVTIGTSPFAARSCPALSAIEAPLYNMGRQGCRLLFDILDNLNGAEGAAAGRDVITLDWAFEERESS